MIQFLRIGGKTIVSEVAEPPAPKSNPRIDPAKKYTTRDGRKVEILRVLNCGSHPVFGVIISNNGNEAAECWMPDGRKHTNATTDDDLIEARETIKGWLNVYEDDGKIRIGDFHKTRESADLASRPTRIACIPVEFKRGDGIEVKP